MWHFIKAQIDLYKMIFALSFLGIGLMVLAFGIKLIPRENPSIDSVYVHQLIAQLRDRNLNLSNRVEAISALARLRAGAKEAVPELMAAVSDPNFHVKWMAVDALGKIGTNAQEACPLLIKCLRDWPLTHKRLISSFLSDLIPLLRDNRESKAIFWLDTISESLMAISPGNSKTISMLADLLDEKDSDVVAASCRILSVIATNLGPAEAKLIQLSTNNDEFIKVSALCALGKPKPCKPIVMSAINDALSDPRSAVRECALDLLSNFGSSSVPAIKSILSVLTQSTNETVDMKYLLNNLNPPLSWEENMQSNPALHYTLPTMFGGRGKNWPSCVRYKSLRTLAEIGPGANEALPSVMKIVSDESDSLRLEAAVAAYYLGAAYIDIFQPLSRALSDSSEDTRRVALGELKRIAKNCSGAASTMAIGLEDRNLSLRLETLNALGDIGTNALTALPALEKATRDSKLIIREAAKQLIMKLRKEKS